MREHSPDQSPRSRSGRILDDAFRRRWGIRLRSALISMGVLTVALAAVSAALLLTLKFTLESAGAAAASARVDQLVSSLQDEPAAELDAVLLDSDGNRLVVQVLDSTGTIIGATPGAPTAPMTELRPTDTAKVDLGRLEVPGQAGDFWIYTQTTTTAAGTVQVIVGSFQEPTEQTLTTVAVGLGVSAPVIVLIVGLATYVLIGRTLKPVEAIRGRVAAITSADLTERVPVPTSTDEISRLAHTMNDMLARLEAGQSAQQVFVGNASHELRSPLATIITALEVGTHRPELLDIDLVSTTLLPEARRMQQLVDDLLLLATADERGLRPRLVDVDLDDLADTETRRQRGLPTHHDKTIVLAATPTRVHGDTGHLARLLRNLMDNALRHADNTVHLTITTAEHIAAITVEDDGPGIAPADRDRVLQRFVRLDTGRARTSGGTGLGLAIVAEIVDAHHGTLTITDSTLGGARIDVTLPQPDSDQPR